MTQVPTCNNSYYKGKDKLLIPVETTLQNIRRFYGKITGNQLPVHFPSFFTGARKHFQESGTVR